MNKRQKGILEDYKKKTCEGELLDLQDVYDRPSWVKMQIWEHIKEDCKAMYGWGLTVLSYNSQMFTAAFKRSYKGKKYLRYYTRWSTEDIPLQEG